MPRLFQFVSILVLSFFLFIVPSETSAVETCSGAVADESGNPIEAVKIDLYRGIPPAITQTEHTTTDGKYMFRTDGFVSAGSLGTNKIVFSKAGYQDQIFPHPGEDLSCPSDITMTSTGGTGYTCNKGTCEAVTSGGTFPDEPTCKTDCGEFILDDRLKQCFPKKPGITGTLFYSKKECESNVPSASLDKYKFYASTNTCVKDPLGVSLDECEKMKSSLSGSGIDCSKEPGKCSSSAGEFCDAAKKELKTAIGCIPTEPSALIGALLKFAAGGAGGIALLLMIFGAFRMVTSAGNPESLKAGQEQFSSAVIGLLFIIFAVLLLEIIGIDILGLPGFKP